MIQLVLFLTIYHFDNLMHVIGTLPLFSLRVVCTTIAMPAVVYQRIAMMPHSKSFSIFAAICGFFKCLEKK